MKSETENTLYPLLCDLPQQERPSAWRTPITDGGVSKSIGQNWKGSYGMFEPYSSRSLTHVLSLQAYIPELADLEQIRARDNSGGCQSEAVPDAIDYDEGFQSLNLDPLPSPNVMNWPRAFEQNLHALPSKQILEQIKAEERTEAKESVSPRRSGRGSHRDRRIDSSISWDNLLPDSDVTQVSPRRQPAKARSKDFPRPGKDYVVFSGTGRDFGSFNCSGVISKLPSQSGISGWRRLCMMKYNVNITSPASSQSSASSSPPSSTPSTPSFSTASSASSVLSAMSNGMSTPNTSSSDPFAWTNETGTDDLQIVDEDCWCYQGAILPGGRIILGRWWHPLEEGDAITATGPFIFWNVG